MQEAADIAEPSRYFTLETIDFLVFEFGKLKYEKYFSVYEFGKLKYKKYFSVFVFGKLKCGKYFLVFEKYLLVFEDDGSENGVSRWSQRSYNKVSRNQWLQLYVVILIGSLTVWNKLF